VVPPPLLRFQAQRAPVITRSRLPKGWALVRPALPAPVITRSRQLRAWVRAQLLHLALFLVPCLLAPRRECLAPAVLAVSVPVALVDLVAPPVPLVPVEVSAPVVPVLERELVPVLVRLRALVLVLIARLPVVPVGVVVVQAVVPPARLVVAAERARLVSRSVRREQNSSSARHRRWVVSASPVVMATAPSVCAGALHWLTSPRRLVQAPLTS
jgi:hypothetical protein